ncbi:NAD(P)/FAD-dependent oxidoreductase [Pseudonocardia sp. ICBG1293]|uniref:NAD(P)/FAD-dependent oxidoreductase n=1 Tax=Pseudonocardia sp. ICBG1293 TaxID=2844382 RepID=UPI001CCDFD0A|nr:NAD(P)/FAD-dependent oxidoreductase [Pseudonocardia sp. ICBG1293]
MDTALHTMDTARTHDVVVVGGGPAGLNGAMMLARSLRSVVVVDSGLPRNAPADAAHGLFARDGVAPAELLATGREEVRRYGGTVLHGEVVGARRSGGGFAVTLADGTALGARRLLVTTGLDDVLPDVPGLAQGWGADVVHCPYCHGYEVRDRPIAVLGTAPGSAHQALLFRQLSADVVYATHTVGPTPEQRERFDALGITVVDGPVGEVVRSDGAVTGLVTPSGVVAREIVAVATRMEARAGFLAELGLVPVEHPSGMGRHLVADATGASTVEGVWLAGNVTDPGAQVGAAAAAGAFAGAAINADLVEAGALAALREVAHL